MSERLEEEQLRKLVELGPAMVSELDLDIVLDRLLETGCSITGAGYAVIRIRDPQRRELERFVRRGVTAGQEEGPPTGVSLGVPVVIGERVWGNLYLTDKRGGGGFTASDQWAATMLAAWTAIAIEHGRLRTATIERQAALEDAIRRLEATQAVAVAVGAETDLGRVLELIAKRGREIVAARSLLILLSDGEDLVLASAAGHAEVRVGARIPVAESTAGEVMLARRPVRIDDPAVQLRFAPERLGVGDARSALLVPLVYRGQARGVMAAFDHESDRIRFTEEEEQVLVAFAASAATAVATAQTVQADRLKHSLDAAEAERKHWARELHDETLQALGRLKMLASAARRGADPELMGRALEELSDGLEQQIESVHTIISELRPAALDDLGLRPAIEALAERYAAIHGSEVVCDLRIPNPVDGDRRLAPEVETTVYRLVQEALTNAAKHSDAGRLTIAIAADDGAVAVQVADDGVGFDAASVSSGYGLAGMRERVALAGGTIEIESGGRGTIVRAVLPAQIPA